MCGPGETALNWRHIVPEMLAAGFLRDCQELPGQLGRGGANRNENRAGVLWGVLDALDQRAGRWRAWHILAHGSGCAAALMMALTQPDSVASLALICPVLEPPLGRLALALMRGRYGRQVGESWYRWNIESERNFAHLAERAYGMRPSPTLLRALRKPLLRRGAAGRVARVVRDGYALPKEGVCAAVPGDGAGRRARPVRALCRAGDFRRGAAIRFARRLVPGGNRLGRGARLFARLV